MTATAYQLRNALATNSTASDHVAKIPVTTLPSNDGFHWLMDPDYGYSTSLSAKVPEGVFIQPWGTDSNDDAFGMRLWGWSKVFAQDIWVPHLILDATVTLGNIAQGTASTFMADTIAVTSNHAEAETGKTFNVTPANDLSASIIVHTRGAEWIEFDFDLDTGAAAMNAWWRPIDYLS